jgi:hypothetical protein
MDRTQYGFEIRRHALIRAMERGVTPDMIEATLKGGTIERFGKRNIRFCKEYKRFTVICVDEITGDIIKIVTIETRRH